MVDAPPVVVRHLTYEEMFPEGEALKKLEMAAHRPFHNTRSRTYPPKSIPLTYYFGKKEKGDFKKRRKRKKKKKVPEPEPEPEPDPVPVKRLKVLYPVDRSNRPREPQVSDPPPFNPAHYYWYYDGAKLVREPRCRSKLSGDGGMMKMVPQMNESPPCKKLRLGDSKPDIHMPLRIDTDRARSGPAYNPQVEAISPTLPSESIRDESPLRSTKEDLLSHIARVDREIAKTESQIAKLKKKKVELEEAATQPQKDTEEISNASDSVIQSLPQSIYADNRKKALEAHNGLMKLGNRNDLPLYNQPSDSPVYHENNVKYSNFKTKLVEYFKTKQKEKDRVDTYLTTTYAKLSIEWARSVERIENSPKRKAQEAKKRELFEKVFPELRKQREDKERFSRVSRIKSDADLEEIMDGLHEQEMEDKKMRSYAVIPPALLDEKTRNRRFINTNGLIEDPMQEYKDKQLLNLWTDQEKDVFKEKYLQHPKNFGVIKCHLERKCVSDCVQYYYLSKKTQNYRQLLRKNRSRTRSTRNQQQNNSNANSNSNNAQVLNVGAAPVKLETNGVTTRQQKEQKTDQQGVSSSINCAINQPSGTSNDNSNSNPPVPMPSSTASLIGNEESTTIPQSVPSSVYSGQPKKKCKGDPKDNVMNEMDTSEEDTLDINGDKGGPHQCKCCKTMLESYMQSRPINRLQASQYGLNENEIQSGDRVCASCRCKAVRRRVKTSQCPIPTCPVKRPRIKRLRPFPAKWSEIGEERRGAIIAKYQIPPNATKCCSACFNRINRRLSPNASLETPDDPGSDTTRWTDEEIESMKKALVEIGKDWIKLPERITTKSEVQCRNFYFNFRKKFGLDALVQEFKKSKGGDNGPPTLTDEEESGSTTSSCDETGTSIHDQTRATMEKKDEYDSSATVSAEEGGIEPDKPNSMEDMKTLPNNPDSPLQLTIRSNNIGSPNPFISSQKPLKLAVSHPAPVHHTGLHQNPPTVQVQPSGPMPVSRHQSPHVGMSHHHVPINPLSNHQFPTQAFSHGQPQIAHIVTQTQGQQQPHLSSVPHHMSTLQGRRYPSPDNGDSQEPLTVKLNDLLQATIESRLPPRNPNAGPMHPGPSVSPTISSILKSQPSHLSIPTGTHMMNQIPQSHSSSQSQQNQQHPQVSAPSPHYQQQHPMYYGAKVDMRGLPQSHLVSHEVLSLVQVSAREECGTLDLSMKKRPVSPQVSIQRPPSNGPPPAHQPIDFASRPGQSQNDLYYANNKFTSIRNRVSQLPPPPPKPSPKVPPPPLLTKPPTSSPMKDGSITHGTPMHHSQPMPTKYEGLLRPTKEGSITQGTPVDKMRGKESAPSPYVTYDRSPEYYKRMSPAAPYFHGSPSAYYGQRPPSTGQRNSPPTGLPPSTYSSDQHNNSRQIIINDYYTSQQMQQPVLPHSQHLTQNSLGQPRLEPPKRNIAPATLTGPSGNPSVYVISQRPEMSYRQSPSPSHPPHPQQRQGVIHRANTNNRGVVKVEPGRIQHDAFDQLVDVAVSAQSLPVPKDDARNRVNLPRVDMVREGLGKSMVEMERNRMGPVPSHPQLYRPPSGIQNQAGPDVVRVERIRVEPEPGRYGRDSSSQDSTLTAASLIDAIITHQINQPSPKDRQSPAPSRSDRLFSSFVRPSQPQIQPQNMSIPSVTLHNPGHHIMSAQSIGHSEDKMDETRAVNHKAQGSTWGEHINLIISNDYALGKGSSGPLLSSGSSIHEHIPISSASQIQQQQQHKKEDIGNFKSWKLRLALQREKEQQQYQHQNHPDERHIIKISQQDDHPPGRPSSIPSSGHDALSHKNTDDSSDTASSTPSSMPPVSNVGSSVPTEFLRKSTKETMSPLDYVNNLIKEKMKTENSDEKSDDDKSKMVYENSIPSGSSHSPSSGVHPSVLGNSNQSNLIGNFPNVSVNSSMMEERSSSVDPPRYSEASQQGDKKEEDAMKSGESDSPASMIIDESADDVKDKSVCSGGSETASIVNTNQPNYEPLTDEET